MAATAEQRKQLRESARKAALLEQQRIRCSDEEVPQYEYFLYDNLLRRARGETPRTLQEYWTHKNHALDKGFALGQAEPSDRVVNATNASETTSETPQSHVVSVTPNVSGSPDQSNATVPTTANAQGVEVAGPGPETTSAFRAKVQFVLEMLDAQVATWWKSFSISGLVRSRDASGWLTWPLENVFTTVENRRPIITVDKNFTAGQTAEEIILNARNAKGAFRDSFVDFRIPRWDGPVELRKERQHTVHQSGAEAGAIAEIFINSFVSVLGPGGAFVVTVNDVAENGLSWDQLLYALPVVMAKLPRGAKWLKIRILAKGSKVAREIEFSVEVLEKLKQLHPDKQKEIVNAVRAAKTDAEAKAIIERGVAGATRPKPALPPPVAEDRAPIGRGKTKRYEPHIAAANSEEALAHAVHELPNEVVIRWGKPVTANGPDVISYNLDTKRITFWDDKTRSRPTRIGPSNTFQKTETMSNAIQEATEAIKNSQLSAADKVAAFKSLEENTFQTRTHGSGNVKNSTFGDHQ